MGITISMNCPGCGGAVYVNEGSHTVKCGYCGLLMEVRGDDGIKKITLNIILDYDKAVATVKKWWEFGYKASDLPQSGEVVECYPIYLPFWRLKAKAVGFICGYRNNDRHEPMEIPVYRYMVWDEAACDPGDTGIGHLDSVIGEALYELKGKALPYNEGSVPAFDVTTSRNDAMSKGLKYISQKIKRETERRYSMVYLLGTSTFERIHVFPLDMSLIYYPIWIVRYRYMDRIYFATVDGVNGGVLTGRAPAGLIVRNLIMAAGMALGGFGSALSLWIGGNIGYSGKNAITAMAVSTLPVVFLLFAYVCYSNYIEGPDIVYGGEFGNKT